MRRRRLLLALSVALVVGAAGFVWFEPHKLVIDDDVAEELPAGAVRRVARGDFRPLEHHADGTAELLTTSGGAHVLRFDDLDTSNGPDLRVYLSSAPPDADWGAFDDDFVDLGMLKGNIGDQNYVVPDGTDLARYRTAVVWCRRFSVPFASAGLERT
ncbi:MAG: DM13 domain-containing protein [Actinobacteria bacterium]|nr:DM13 domain-containing protein [Actinomycetota bacterium]